MHIMADLRNVIMATFSIIVFTRCHYYYLHCPVLLCFSFKVNSESLYKFDVHLDYKIKKLKIKEFCA